MIPQNVDDETLRAAICGAGPIAVVGASAKPERPVHAVMRYLIAHGYEIHPVNPGLAGQELLGRRVYASLADVPGPVDVVDIFRRPEDLGGVVDEALALPTLPRVIWMQLGLADEAAANRARARGLTVVMDHCTKIEHARLCG